MEVLTNNQNNLYGVVTYDLRKLQAYDIHLKVNFEVPIERNILSIV